MKTLHKDELKGIIGETLEGVRSGKVNYRAGATVSRLVNSNIAIFTKEMEYAKMTGKTPKIKEMDDK